MSKSYDKSGIIFTNYNSSVANEELLMDMVLYVRRTCGVAFAPKTQIKGDYCCNLWEWDQFTNVKRQPISMPRPYIYENKLISEKVFAEREVMEKLWCYPGLPNRNKKKLREGIALKIGHAGVDSRFVAMNASDRSGDRTNGVELSKINMNLREAYLSFIDKGKGNGWGFLEKMTLEFHKRYPEVQLFKAGMNVQEQLLAHLDSAGYFFNRMCVDLNVRNLVNIKETYVSSLNFEQQIRGIYKDKVAHYFDDILQNHQHAEDIKMRYKY